MYSLIITVKSISFAYCVDQLLSQYADYTETKLNHGEDYRIPSLVWPPPIFQSFQIQGTSGSYQSDLDGGSK